MATEVSAILVNTSVDQFFNGAKDEFLKDFLNFNSRKNFDAYMKTLETNYYDQVKLPKSPYIDVASGNITT